MRRSRRPSCRARELCVWVFCVRIVVSRVRESSLTVSESMSPAWQRASEGCGAGLTSKRNVNGVYSTRLALISLSRIPARSLGGRRESLARCRTRWRELREVTNTNTNTNTNMHSRMSVFHIQHAVRRLLLLPYRYGGNYRPVAVCSRLLACLDVIVIYIHV